MRLLRKKQKTAFAIFLIFEFFITSAFPASAGMFGGSVSIPSASSMASELESRYNLNLGSIQEQAQGFNVAGNKALAPEVSLFFSPSDPREGEKISAKAFPMYFSNPEESLYYTWFLRRDGCRLRDNVTNIEILDRCNASDRNRGTDNRQNPGDITIEDWKIEAAKIIVQNGYDSSGTRYSSDSDSDGYQARFGGGNKIKGADYCYVNNSQTGENYELADAANLSFTCPEGTSPVCMVGDATVTSGLNDLAGGNSFFDFTDSETCHVSGSPVCSSSGVPTCNTGTPRCVASPETTSSCGSELLSCTPSAFSSVTSLCKHLFPNLPSSGNGDFGAGEERFWGTDPKDPDTADNGNKDEANVVGLGQSSFTWNYVAGDQVGVAVEGTSMIPTKHSDSSYMIMWAFPKKNCNPKAADLGSYTRTIKGYSVTIPTADFDLNECIERNLVDPTEGGQATKLEVNVTATPDNPVNDATSDGSGDIVMAQANVSNTQQGVSNVYFDWNVEIKDDTNFTDSVGRIDITTELRGWELLGNTKGNALDTIRLKLDILNNNQFRFSNGKKLSDYLNSSGIGYLRFKVKATESFAGGGTRTGKSDVIVKFISSGKKISTYRAKTDPDGDVMKVTLTNTNNICNADALEKTVCPIIKNDIIGLKVDNPTGPDHLENFKWTINGVPLTCSKTVSNGCSNSEQNGINFFPVTGNVGDTYTVAVTANNVATGNVVTLTRTFHIIQPIVTIESLDRDIVWPKFLGQYRDITGEATAACPAGLCSDYSTSIFEAVSGGQLGFRAVFIPGFLGADAQREWTVDGVREAEDPSRPREISFTASKPALSIYNVNLSARVAQRDDIRRALLDIWNVSPFDSSEINFAVSNQVEILEPGLAEGPLQDERKYLAAIASYVPASVMFTFRILLSAVLVLFTTSFLLSLLQDRRMKAFVSSIPEKKF